jgi:hypothetical protein
MDDLHVLDRTFGFCVWWSFLVLVDLVLSDQAAALSDQYRTAYLTYLTKKSRIEPFGCVMLTKRVPRFGRVRSWLARNPFDFIG